MMDTGNLRRRAAPKRDPKGLEICEQGTAALSSQGCLGQQQKKYSLQSECARNVGEKKREGSI